MTRYDLTNWTLIAPDHADVPAPVRGRELTASVPGCVHTDLLAQGLIPDPYYGTNENEVQWIGFQDWQYRSSFELERLEDFERLELVCEGLDTVATLDLNGVEIGKSETMHAAHRFDVKDSLRRGKNDLTITFHSAIHYAEAQRERIGYLPTSEYPHPFNFIRKMACNFGWDWGPTLVTAGIWRPIYLESWTHARLASVRPLVMDVSEEMATVEVRADTVHADTGSGGEGLELVSTLFDPNGEEVTRQTSTTSPLHLNVMDPQLWWPRGHGEQPLYTLKTQLRREGEVVDAKTQRIGLRSVALDTGVDGIGSKFTLLVNGKPIFCKGANWIPDDCFPTRITREHLRERITQALDANMNMLRVWGGGFYESDTFYDLCDERGVLVWQDFMFACAAYPEEAPFDALVEAEARCQVTRLAPHPSLVLWNGCNENLWGYFGWETNGKTWRQWVEGRTWGAGYYFDLLPKVVQALDPSRPYSPGSPYSNAMNIHPLSEDHGTMHIWDVWNHADYEDYRRYVPRFSSEFGFQAPPTWSTLTASLPETQLGANSEGMRHRQKASGGQEKLQRWLEAHFAAPDTFEAWHFGAQLNQARAVQLGVEWWRAHAPRCIGTLYWQLNDCWPVTSWSAVDGYGRKKLLWYATRKFYADRLLTFQPQGAQLFLYVINDTDETWQEEVEMCRRTFAGAKSAVNVQTLKVAPRSVERIALETPLTSAEDTREDTRAEYLAATTKADAETTKAHWFFERDRHLDYPTPKFEVGLDATPTGCALTLTAQSFLRDLCIFADKLDADAEVSEQLVTLERGESFTFNITTSQALTLELILREGIIQSANTLSLQRAARYQRGC